MSKKNLWLLLILAVLIGLMAVYQYWWLPRRYSQNQEINFLAKVNFDQVDKISVKRGATETTLLKAGDRWRVDTAGDWYVNRLLMDNLKQAWQTAATNTIFLVSNSQGTKPDFKTDGSLLVKFYQGGNSLGGWNLGLSRAGASYISPLGTEATYEVSGNLRGVFDYEEWRDFAIWPEPTLTFNKLTISRGREVLTLEKSGADWVRGSNKKIKLASNRLNQLISMMNDLSASSLAGPQDRATGLEPGQLIIEASGPEGQRRLIIGQERRLNDKPSGEFYVKTNQNNNLYLISREQRAVFDAGLKDLR